MHLNSQNSVYKALVCFLIFIYFNSNIFAQQKPNVIFILSDDLGFNLLSVNGNKSYHTPNIDSIARHGINFTHCEGTPLCSPSRSMLLTGKYNFRNYSNWAYMNENEKTFGNVMHDGGYKTGFFGKLQLQFSPTIMQRWGFDTYDIFSLTEDSIQTQRYKSPTLMDNNGRVPDIITKDKYCDDILTERICKFIDDNANQPFFAYYSMSLVHDPFSPTPEDSAYKTWKPDSKVSDTSFFHSMVKHMDIEVGKILNKLKQKGLDKNTIVIFAGDNGTPFQIYYDVDENSDIEGEKRATTEGGTHVPLVAYWPSHIQAGQKNDDLIDFTDFFSTFAEIAGTKDLSMYGKVDGLSFYKRMLGVEDTSKKQLFMHYSAHPGFDKLKRWVRDKTYKLYDSSNGGNFKFYNIIDDEKELKPLDDDSLTREERAIKKKFKQVLDSFDFWKKAPSLNQVFVKNITSNSATIGATVVDAGFSPLIDRGSNIIGSNLIPTLGQHRKRDTVVSLGSFSQERVGLTAETSYGFSIYAMNQNVSNSTGYIRSKFFTLSAAPVSQPSYFKACADSSSVLLNWGHAVFPSSGAKLRGYAVFYSTEKIVLSENSNGNGPAMATKNAKLLYTNTNNNANKLDTFLRVSSLAKNTGYYFLLVPYTWNGTTDSTYNYLTANALSAKVNFAEPISTNFTNKNPSCFDSKDGRIKVSALNGIAPYYFSLGNKDYTSDSVFNNLSAGEYLLTVRDAQGCINSDSVILKSPAKIKLSLSVKNTNCEPDGKIIASAKDGIPPYMFSFNNGNFDTTSHFTNLSNGDYKISVRDSNNCVVSSDTKVSSTNQNCPADISISPNPSNSFFKITIGNSLISAHIKIKVYGATDKLVFTAQGAEKESYTFGNTFLRGVYFVEVGTETKIYKFKIIKD